jgi:hydroxymethylpyrimidine pyrophosphatase-like HAD family hydrolase
MTGSTVGSSRVPSSARFDIVISDIDGCMAPESAGPMNPMKLANVAAYNVAAEQLRDRPVVTLCSGRPQPYGEALSRMIANVSVPIICEMGVWLYDPRDNAFLFDPAITREHMSRMHACEAWIRETLCPKGVVIQPGKTASVSLWHKDTSYLMSLKPVIIEKIASEGWDMRVANTVAWINIELQHVSKASGISRLLKMTGTPKQRLAGIGDTMGDMAIREAVSFFACPANADPKLKTYADYVSPHEDVDGVLDILERLR